MGTNDFMRFSPICNGWWCLINTRLLVCMHRAPWKAKGARSPPRPETTVGESEVLAPGSKHLRSESVEGAALALERVDDVHGGDGLAAGVLGVGHGVTDDVLEEDLEDTAGLLVDEAADALDTTTAREAADGGLGDALDVVAKDLAVALGAALSESLASLSTSRHD